MFFVSDIIQKKMAPAPAKHSSLLKPQSKEKEVLMGFQKTKNCRDRKKKKEQKEKKIMADRLRYLIKKGDKVGVMEASLKDSEETIKKKQVEIEKGLQVIQEEQEKAKKTKANMTKEIQYMRSEMKKLQKKRKQ